MKPISYYDLLDAFKLEGCPVCTLLQKDADRCIDALLYEYTADNETQNSLRASRGLCNTHAWQMRERKGNSTGMAMLYRSAVHELVDLLSDLPHKSTNAAQGLPLLRALGLGRGAGAAIAERLKPTGQCFCCATLEASEDGYLLALALGAGAAEFQNAYQQSHGLCLFHFRALLRRITTPEAVEALVRMQLTIWQTLAHNLEVFMDKIDMNLDVSAFTEDEGASWARAIESLAGARGILGVHWRKSFD